MDAEFASTTHSQISQSEAFLSLGLFDKTNFTSSYIVPENGLLYVQVSYKYFVVIYKWIYKWIYKCSLQVHLSALISVLFV
jgi:hypothetical protein